MRIVLDTHNLDDYQRFLQIKGLPTYAFQGRTAIVPDEYARMIQGVDSIVAPKADYVPHPQMFDYQCDIIRLAVQKRKFCIFADCGLGKTLMFLDWSRHVLGELPDDKCILIVSPLMVTNQTIDEARIFYGDTLPIEKVPSNALGEWLKTGTARIGITNYEALTNPVEQGRLGALVLDESSMLKSHYGKWGTECLRLGAGLDWKLAGTGTPAPNDRIEYANHAVFMDAFPSVNSFLARFFVNRGQTNERWEIKHHALRPFYRHLSHWCVFLTDPSVYGWSDNAEPLPPIVVHRHHVGMTPEQQSIAYHATGSLFADQIGGITSRSVLSQMAKGWFQGRRLASNKPGFIKMLVDSWPDESTIIWCIYNAEQQIMAETFPDAANISGSTPFETREAMIEDFKMGRRRVLITKPKILGFGLNLQVATRHVFSGLQDSYESFYQAVKRSNRYGAIHPLNVHIPFTDVEHPMIETVMSKADRVAMDAQEQEALFRDAGYFEWK